jgi:predicted transcriptional regulator YheO
MKGNVRDESMRYAPTADAISQTFGENGEVALHELTTPNLPLFIQ